MALRSFAAAFALCLAAQVSLQAAPGPSRAENSGPDRTGALTAESGLFQDRLLRPWNHFLVDGQHAFVAGREFHRASEMDAWLGADWPSDPQALSGAGASDALSPATGVFLWPVHPWQSLRPYSGWLRDTAAIAFRGSVGNEVGDPLLGELTGVSGSDNHTPLTSGGVSAAPSKSLRLFGGLDQNDHFSFRTLPDRVGLVGEEDGERLSWIGANLPPKSQAQLGAEWKGGRSSLAVNVNRGWWWTASPVSGAVHPWEGFNNEIQYRLGGPQDPGPPSEAAPLFDATLIAQDWSMNRAASFHDSRYRRYEAGLGLQGSLAGRQWRLETGYAKRMLDSDSAFAPMDASDFPSAFRYRRDWERSFAGHSLETGSQGSLAVRSGMFSAQHAKGFRAAWGRHGAAQTLKAYYHRRLEGFQKPIEYSRNGADSAFFFPGKHARGLAASAEYSHTRGGIRLEAGVAHAWDWQAPVFRGDIPDTVVQFPRREGMLAGSDHALANGSGRLTISGSTGRAAAWELEAGLRKFYGRDADRIEYLPSPWWLGGGGGFTFPSDLRVETRLNYLGPKRVRGWGPELRVPAHWENNLGLSQTLFDNGLELTVSMLHAFGDEVLEHPAGNPLRFRLLVGCRGAF